MRWKKPMAAIGALALLAAGACGGSDDGGESTSERDLDIEGAGLAQDPNVEPPAAEIEGAQSGGTVTVLSALGLNTMHPSEAYYTNTGSILTNLVTRTLTQYRYNPEIEGMELVPDLATDLGRPNEDFTEWTFTLRDGVRYEDGTEVQPEDFVTATEMSFDRTQFPDGAEYSNEYFLNGYDEKGNPLYEGRYTDPNGSCECVEVNGNDITFKMARPFPSMNYWATFPAMSPIPADKSQDPEQYALHPLSTGPYMFEDYEPETSLTLVKNPEWDPNTDPARHQYVDQWNMEFLEDSSALDQVIIEDQGDAQTTLTYDNLLLPDYQKAKQEAPERIVEGADACQFYVYPDTRKITDPKVREAMAWAYPYEDAWLAGGEIVGVTRSPDTQIIPRGTDGRVQPPYDVYGNGGRETDPQRARQLLEEAGKVGMQLRFLYASDDPASVDVKDVLVRAWREAGFEPKPVATTIAEFSTLRADPNTPIDYRTGGWCHDWPAWDSWLPPLFQTDQYANYSFFSSKQVDQRIREIQDMPPEEATQAASELEQDIMEQYKPVIPVGKGGVAMMHGSRINGMEVDAVYGLPTWRDIWISQ
jgi:peptide/nickel transport system substrate-binding protein